MWQRLSPEKIFELHNLNLLEAKLKYTTFNWCKKDFSNRWNVVSLQPPVSLKWKIPPSCFHLNQTRFEVQCLCLALNCLACLSSGKEVHTTSTECSEIKEKSQILWYFQDFPLLCETEFIHMENQLRNLYNWYSSL